MPNTATDAATGGAMVRLAAGDILQLYNASNFAVTFSGCKLRLVRMTD